MASQAPTVDESEAALRDLCARLWQEPDRLTSVRSHAVADRFEIDLHQHQQTLQLDLIDGCGGTAQNDNRRTKLAGLTLLVSYPGQSHGYQLLEQAPPSRVYHVKLRVSRRWPAIRMRLWPSIETNCPPQPWVHEAMGQLTDFEKFLHQNRVGRVAALCQVLCHWPSGLNQPTSHQPFATTADEAVRLALDAVDQRLHEALTVDDLARAAHLSPRQFVRRFRRVVGSTPHDFINARRLVRASELLLNPRLSVADVAEQTGFSSTATFSRWFTQQTNDTPTAYRADPKRM